MLGTFVGGTSYVDAQTKKQHFSLDVVDLDRDEVQRIALDFLPHGFAAKPGAPHLAAVFEKRGPGAALVDLEARKLVGKIRARAGRAYYGHGTYTRDGSALLVVEIDEARRGLMSVRDGTTYKELDAFPTYGESPHDCVPIDDGKVLVVTNGGGAIGGSEPSVTYVEVASRKLLEKVTFSDPKINAGHVAVAKDGSLAIVSAPRDGLPKETSAGGITLRIGKRKPERMRGPDAVMAKVVGESLSVCVHEPTGVVGVTNPSGGIVTFWSLRTAKLVGTHVCPSPRGIELTSDGTAFVVSFGTDAGVVVIDAESLVPRDRSFGKRRLSGSHLFVHPTLLRGDDRRPSEGG